MKIKLNGEDKSVEAVINLSDFVVQQLNGKKPNGVAVALNSMVIPKQKWESVKIKENDSIEIIHAVQGG
jgi:sulfur carrier protein